MKTSPRPNDLSKKEAHEAKKFFFHQDAIFSANPVSVSGLFPPEAEKAAFDMKNESYLSSR